MKRHGRVIVGIMGSTQATPDELNRARLVGAALAAQGWITLTGGEPRGVMDAAAEGAAAAGGLTIGILPGSKHTAVSEHIHIPIFTGMGSARNVANALTAHVLVVVSSLTPGTLLEVAAAAQAGVPLVFFGPTEAEIHFMQNHRAQIIVATSIEETIAACTTHLNTAAL